PQFANVNERDLGTHFFLDSDLASPADLEFANVLVRDNPASQRALDLFLGTHGWRRFAVDAGPMQLAKRDEQLKQAAKINESKPSSLPGKAEAELFSVQSANLSDLQAKDQERMTRGLTWLRRQFVGQSAELAKEKTELVEEFGRRFQSLVDYERLPQ